MCRTVDTVEGFEPVVVNKNSDTGLVEVVAGRQRVKCAREANKRIRAEGGTYPRRRFRAGPRAST